LFQSVRNSNIGSYFLFYFSGTDSSPDSNISDLQKITLGNCNATCITVTSILEIGRIGKVRWLLRVMAPRCLDIRGESLQRVTAAVNVAGCRSQAAWSGVAWLF
jgi:hypothetical protein